MNAPRINVRLPHLSTFDSSNTMITSENFLVGFYIVLRGRSKKTVSIYEACKASKEKNEIINS